MAESSCSAEYDFCTELGKQTFLLKSENSQIFMIYPQISYCQVPTLSQNSQKSCFYDFLYVNIWITVEHNVLYF